MQELGMEGAGLSPRVGTLVTLAQLSLDPPRLTRPAKNPFTVKAPPLSPCAISSIELLVFEQFERKAFYHLFPYVAAAFLIAPSTKHALAKGDSIFLHICLTLHLAENWNLKRKRGDTL